VLFSLCG